VLDAETVVSVLTYVIKREFDRMAIVVRASPTKPLTINPGCA